MYAKAGGKKLTETGVTLDNLKCVFNYVQANRTDFELRLWNQQRVSRRKLSLPPSLLPSLLPSFQHRSQKHLLISCCSASHTYPSLPLSLPPSLPLGLVQGREDR